MSIIQRDPKNELGELIVYPPGSVDGAQTLAAGRPRTAQTKLDIGDLAIHVTGSALARGRAVAKLFAPGHNVLGPGRWQAAMRIDGDALMFRCDGLRAGRYAAVMFHNFERLKFDSTSSFGTACNAVERLIKTWTR